MKTNTNTYFLNPIFSNQASFYKKAKVTEFGNTKTLVSYSTKVAEIANGELTIFGFHSQMTLKHIKEFTQQNGFPKCGKKELEQYLEYNKKAEAV